MLIISGNLFKDPYLGKVVEEFGFPSIEVEKMTKMPFQANPKA